MTAKRKVLRLADSSVLTRPDTLVVEELLEIRVGGAPLTVTMRTPGDDFDLVPGFLVAEGAVARAEDVVAMRYCPGATDDGATTYNVIDVIPAPGVVPPAPRAQLTTSACGVCGTASIDLVRARTRWPVNADPVEVAPATLAGLPETLRATQQVFERTGGLHAAGLFTANGVLVCLREDVGRHNAADKVIGAMLRADRLPLAGHVLLVSGRASFELVQKALAAGIPVLAAVSAPSSLAVDLARDAGMTLVGFLRGRSMNVYAGFERIAAVGPNLAAR